MQSFLSFIFWVAFIALVAGLIKPAWFAWLFKKRATRKNLALVFGSLFVVVSVWSGILTALSINDTQVKPSPDSKIEGLELSDQQQRQYYIELVAAEDKANAEAEKLYPTDSADPSLWSGNTWLADKFESNFRKGEEYSSQLKKQYKQELRDKYKLTEEQEKLISRRGLNENWPME